MNNDEPVGFNLSLFMILLTVGTVVATSIWMAYDAKAKRITTTKQPYSINNGALAWFISSLAFWIATLPYYLIRRRQILKERQQAAVAAAPARLTISFDGSRNVRDEMRERRNDLAGYYDTAQICRNGHVMTSHYNTCPQNRQEFCDQCGESTLTKCEHCAHPIRGDYDVPGVSARGRYVAPSYCHSCGRTYPWTVQKLQAAKELIDELEPLDEREKQSLKLSLDELIRDTPKTEAALFRFKKLMKKAGREPYDAVKAIVSDFVSETVRRSLDSIDFGNTQFLVHPQASISPFPRESGERRGGSAEGTCSPGGEKKLIIPL